jgi:hypothetical protein
MRNAKDSMGNKELNPLRVFRVCRDIQKVSWMKFDIIESFPAVNNLVLCT